MVDYYRAGKVDYFIEPDIYSLPLFYSAGFLSIDATQDILSNTFASL